MAFMKWSSIFRLLPFALAALPAVSAERHNLILMVPTALPANAVDRDSAAALEPLRAEGVFFVNSYSGFPRLEVKRPEATGTYVDVSPVIAAAAETYSSAMVDDTGEPPRMSPVDARFLGQSILLRNMVNVLLPRFKAAGRPFVIVYRCGMKPAAVNIALSVIERKLRRLEIFDATNIIVAAEQGMSHIYKGGGEDLRIGGGTDRSEWSPMPTGFLAMDLAAALGRTRLGLRLFDLDEGSARVKRRAGSRLTLGNGLIGRTPRRSLVYVEAMGDHDRIYLAETLSKRSAERLAKAIVGAVIRSGYTGGVFVNKSKVGWPTGTLPLGHIGWRESDHVRVPDIVVTFVSAMADCDEKERCAATLADTPVKEGRTLRGSFSRAETWNFIAARGPDFRKGFMSEVPASNADVVRTIGELLQVSTEAVDALPGRVLVESLRSNEGMPLPEVRAWDVTSMRTRGGFRTEVHLRSVGKAQYFYAAGRPGWTIGIVPRKFPRPPAPRSWD